MQLLAIGLIRSASALIRMIKDTIRMIIGKAGFVLILLENTGITEERHPYFCVFISAISDYYFSIYTI
ncbi:hypothetical protein FDUTEX481_07666 [Tolypothrix sp. PCC 7601]|nr:hypothetical protein FDUTEX481_07666 [Tolypothrix sp. PCC 7601]